MRPEQSPVLHVPKAELSEAQSSLEAPFRPLGPRGAGGPLVEALAGEGGGEGEGEGRDGGHRSPRPRPLQRVNNKQTNKQTNKQKQKNNQPDFKRTKANLKLKWEQVKVAEVGG